MSLEIILKYYETLFFPQRRLGKVKERIDNVKTRMSDNYKKFSKIEKSLFWIYLIGSLLTIVLVWIFRIYAVQIFGVCMVMLLVVFLFQDRFYQRRLSDEIQEHIVFYKKESMKKNKKIRKFLSTMGIERTKQIEVLTSQLENYESIYESTIKLLTQAKGATFVFATVLIGLFVVNKPEEVITDDYIEISLIVIVFLFAFFYIIYALKPVVENFFNKRGKIRQSLIDDLNWYLIMNKDLLD